MLNVIWYSAEISSSSNRRCSAYNGNNRGRNYIKRQLILRSLQFDWPLDYNYFRPIIHVSINIQEITWRCQRIFHTLKTMKNVENELSTTTLKTIAGIGNVSWNVYRGKSCVTGIWAGSAIYKKKELSSSRRFKVNVSVNCFFSYWKKTEWEFEKTWDQ